MLQNWNWPVTYLKQVMTQIRLRKSREKANKRGRKIFTRILEWRSEIMQGRNLTLHKHSDKICPSRIVQYYIHFSVSAISLYPPHCRSPNNIQLYFLAFLRDTDCCKEHLDKCPSPKPSLWLSDLTHILATFLSLYLFSQSQLKHQQICHMFFHLHIQNTFQTFPTNQAGVLQKTAPFIQAWFLPENSCPE